MSGLRPGPVRPNGPRTPIPAGVEEALKDRSFAARLDREEVRSAIGRPGGRA